MAIPDLSTEQRRLEWYQKCVSDAKKDRQELERLWLEMIDMYRGKQWGDGADCDEIMVNMVWSTVNTETAATTVRNPEFLVEPRNKDSIKPAALLTNMINHDWRVYGWKNEVRTAFRDGMITGLGVGKVGYRFDRITDEGLLFTPNGEPNVQEVRKHIDSLSRVGMSSGFRLSAPSDAEISKMITENGKVVANEHPVLERVSPFDILIDPSVTEIRDARWIAQRSLMPVRLAKEVKAWSSSARDDLAGSPMASQSRDGTKYHEDMVYIVEFYDIEEGTVCTFADNGDKYLMTPREIPYPFGHPFAFFENETIPEYLYPIGEVEQIMSLQRELNQTRSDIIADRKEFRRKWMVRKDMLADEEVRKGLQSNKPNSTIPYENPEDLQAIRPLDNPQKTNHLYSESSLIRSEIDLVTGVSEYQRGMTGGSYTATEAAIVNDSSQARVALKLSKAEDFMAALAEKIVMMYQTISERDRIVRFRGAAMHRAAREAGIDANSVERLSDTDVVAGGDMFSIVSREDVAGQFDLAVTAGSSQPVNPTQKRQAAQQLIGILAPFMAEPGLINVEEVLRRVLKDGFQMSDIDSIFLQKEEGPSQEEIASVLQQGAGALGGTVGPEQTQQPVAAIQ